jgi:hypothetical protein
VDAAQLELDEEAHGWIAAAIENAIGLSFDEYTSKVVAFLDPEHADVYADRTAWESMQEDVVARLEALR